MKKRIRNLISAKRQPLEFLELPPNLSERIFQDIQEHKLYSYLDAAKLIGCDPETIRVHAKGFPIIKRTKPHKIPACVLELIVKTKLIAA